MDMIAGAMATLPKDLKSAAFLALVGVSLILMLSSALYADCKTEHFDLINFFLVIISKH